MTMTGEQLECLADQVAAYNSALLEEKAALERKQSAGDAIKLLMQAAQTHDETVIGHRVQVVPWFRRSISVEAAEKVLDAKVFAGLVKESSGVRPDIRPVRGI